MRIATEILAMAFFFLFVSSVLAQQANLKPIPDKLVVLTFDDANISDRTFVAEELKKHGFGATFFLTEGLGFLKNKEHYVSWEQARELHEMGFEIGNHTRHHRNVARLSTHVLAASIKHIEKRCTEHGIPTPKAFCYPGFSHNLRAVQEVEKAGYHFARRGVGPEYSDGGRGARGPAYDPKIDHPLLIPTTGYAGPDWSIDDLKWAVSQAGDGRIAVLCFHGVPGLEHPWVSTRPEDFKIYMEYLKDEGCKVIAMRDLAKYVDPGVRPPEPYLPIQRRARTPAELETEQPGHPLGLDVADVIFRWETTNNRQMPSAWQILVSSDRIRLQAGFGDLWDSGRVFGKAPGRVHYLGRPLPQDAEVWWKVRIWDAKGSAGPFSEAQKFKTAQEVKVVQKRRARVLAGTLKFIDGKFGQGIELGNSGPSVGASDHDLFRRGDGLTISAWIRPASAADLWQTIVRKEDGSRRRLLAIGRTGKTWGLWIGVSISGKYVEFGAPVSAASLADGKWHHVAGTVGGKRIRLFIDGKQVGEKRIAGELDSAGRASLQIGSYLRGREPFTGGIDDVRLFTRGLNPEEIRTLITGSTVAQDDLAGWWKLDGNLDNEVAAAPAPPANRVILLGNTLVANMRKHGYLEAALTGALPGHRISFRNLGWPADDVFGMARSEFGSGRNTRSWRPPCATSGYGLSVLMEQIEDARPETIIAGYGSETAFYDDEEFDRFKKGYVELLDRIEELCRHLILLGPPRQENLGPPMPAAAPRNLRLKRTSDFLAELARKRKLRFIPLFDSLIRAGSGRQLTENGIHLNEQGYQRLALIVAGELLGERRQKPNIQLSSSGQALASLGGRISGLRKTDPGFEFDLTMNALHDSGATLSINGADKAYRLKINGETAAEAGPDEWQAGVNVPQIRQSRQFEKLRRAINEKNRLLASRLRPLNKTYIFLFRRHEMGHLAHEVEDLMRLAEQQEDLIARIGAPSPDRFVLEAIDPWKPPRRYPDHEVPKSIPAPDLAAELKAFTLPPGFQINLFASNPMIANPINANWDTRGRLWVSTSSTYPHLKPGDAPNDRIVILEDHDRDGQADKSTVFADGLMIPHSVMPVKDGAYVCSSTEVLHLIDRDSDDRADERRVVFSGFGNADVHHMIHGLRWAPWGDLHFIQSIYINSFVETPWGARRLNGSGVWRFRPETERLEVYARGMVNPWGFTFDRWGQPFGTDGAGGGGPHFVFRGSAFATATGAPRVLRGMIRGKPKNTAAEFVTGSHLPDEWRGSLLGNDFRANRTVRYELKPQGSGYTAREVQTVIHSRHRSFRPVDLKIGPDGALYVVDWYNPIIDHGEVDFYHPQRDKSHGRIWRVTVKDRPLVKLPKIYGTKIPELIELLKSPERWTRDQVKRELTGRPKKKVIAELDTWEAKLNPRDPEIEHHRLEALWLKGSLRAPDNDLLRKVYASKDYRARAAAIRIASQWHDRLPAALPMLGQAAHDEHPQVRLEAVNGLREVGTLESCNLALKALERQVDTDLEYALWLTARKLKNVWLPALYSGKPVFEGRIDRLSFALRAAESRDAVQAMAKLIRENALSGGARREVLRTLAGLGGAQELDLVIQEASRNRDGATWQAIAEGATSNQAAPSEKQAVLKLLDQADQAARLAALKLIGHWRIDAGNRLKAILTGKESNAPLRRAAAAAMAAFGQTNILQQTASSDLPLPARLAAIEAWSALRPAEAAETASAILSQIKNPQEASPIFGAFIGRDNGPSLLAAALEDKELESTVAAAGIELARESGRDLNKLEETLIRAGSLQPLPAKLSPDQRATLLKEVAQRGVAARGERIYRRDALACTKCHALSGTGGQLGPDLGSLGASMTPESILESLLNPNTTIKQGYETRIIRKKDDLIVSGTLQRKTDRSILLRTPTGIVTIPLNDIEAVQSSPISLMPAGLTQSLRRDELVDLLRFLTALGKEKGFKPEKRSGGLNP